MRDIERIYVHCSDSTFGDAETIKQWHLARGWNDIGYHYVILRDGVVEKGREDIIPGAHVAGDNEESLGVCLIGKGGLYTLKQLIALKKLIWDLKLKYIVMNKNILCHNQAKSAMGKTCPDFTQADLHSLLGAQ